MSIQFSDILSALCDSVKLTHSNDFQTVYALEDMRAAKLVYDVLVSYGFDAKVYHETNKPSKLYLTNPTQTPQQLEQILAAALAYAQTLRQVKRSVDQLCSTDIPSLGAPDYTISFANAHPAGKQLIVHITPEAQPVANAQSAQVLAPRPVAAATVTVTQPKTAKRVVRKGKSHYEELSSGPAVAKAGYPGKLGASGNLEQQGVRKKIFTFLRANIATSSFTMFIMVTALGTIFSLFVFAKAFICPDFASMKRTHAWYCPTNTENANKPQQQQQPGQ
jgi:hypothetical protein